MSEALARLWDVVDENQIEHIEIGTSLRALDAPRRCTASTEHRDSNRVALPRLESQLLVEQSFLGFWNRKRHFPCRIIDLSFSGIRIDSSLRMGEGDVVEIKLRGEKRRDTQVIPIRIVCHRQPQDGTYGYGAQLTKPLNEPFRRLIVSGLTH